MTFRRILLRSLAPVSGIAVLATVLVAQGTQGSPDVSGSTDGHLSRSTPAVVHDRAVPVMPKTQRHPAPPRPHEDHHDESETHLAAADTVVAELPKTDLETFALLGVTWSGGLVDADTAVEVRWRGVDGWSEWTELHVDPADEGNPGTEPHWVGSADAATVRVLSTSGAAPRGLSLATIDPGETPTVTSASALRGASSAVSKPAIISRAAWGASSTGSCDSPIYGSTLRGAVIHHTAGSNTEPKSRSAAVVKATQAYHVNSRDWCDIGYNFLVDRFGQIFEGRKGGVDKVVRGAHAGNGPVNQETTGISLMGTFTTAQPPQAMKDAVVRLTAWKLGMGGVPAKGTYSLGGKTLNRISGHRDVVSTACPGATVYAWLTSSSSTGLRSQVADAIATGGAGMLATPAGLMVKSRTSSSVSLDWDDVVGAEKYHVKVSKSSSMSSPVYGKFTESEGTVAGLTPGAKYYFAVVVVDPARNVRLSEYTAAPHPTATTYAAATPQNLTISSKSMTTVSLDWDDVAGAARYHVKVSKSSTMSSPSYGKFNESKGTVTGLKAGTKYYFSVVVVDPVRNVRLAAYSASPHPSTTTTTVSSSTVDTVTIPDSRKFTLVGHGFGHGIGMSQYGAQNAAINGRTWGAILRYYYPGTKGTKLDATMRVLLTKDTTVSVIVVARSGLKFKNLVTNKTTTLPAKVGGKPVLRWRIQPRSSKPTVSVLQSSTTSGKWVTYAGNEWTGDGQFAAPGPMALVLPDDSTDSYRGVLRSASPSKGSSDRNTVNILPMDDYLRGVVPAEMPSSWKPAALQAQSVAARTYAARSISTSRYYDICDTTSCQVYRGTEIEAAGSDAAIAATAGRIMSYEGKPAFTQFSSSSGGWSAAGSAPYLVAKEDKFDDWSGNPNHTWTKSITAATIEKAYPTIGTLKSLEITKRTGGGDWGGRVTTLVFTGSKGTKSISGTDARSKFGLKSHWFRF